VKVVDLVVRQDAQASMCLPAFKGMTIPTGIPMEPPVRYKLSRNLVLPLLIATALWIGAAVFDTIRAGEIQRPQVPAQRPAGVNPGDGEEQKMQLESQLDAANTLIKSQNKLIAGLEQRVKALEAENASLKKAAEATDAANRK